MYKVIVQDKDDPQKLQETWIEDRNAFCQFFVNGIQCPDISDQIVVDFVPKRFFTIHPKTQKKRRPRLVQSGSMRAFPQCYANLLFRRVFCHEKNICFLMTETTTLPIKLPFPSDDRIIVLKTRNFQLLIITTIFFLD